MAALQPRIAVLLTLSFWTVSCAFGGPVSMAAERADPPGCFGGQGCNDEAALLQARHTNLGPELAEKAKSERAPPNPNLGLDAWLTRQVDLRMFGTANCSYPGVLLPDPTKPLQAMTRTELVVTDTLGQTHGNLVGSFQAAIAASLANPLLAPKTGAWFALAQAATRDLLERYAPEVPAIQSGESAWLGDQFVSDFVAHTYMSMFLETQGDEVVLDLTGQEETRSGIQELKKQIVQTFPSDLLKCKAIFRAHSKGLEVIRIRVVTKGSVLNFSPAPTQTTRWQLAKVIFVGAMAYLYNLWHLCLHVYSSMITVAAQRSLPSSSKLNGMMDAGALRNVYLLLQGLSSLHADHGAAWSGSVYKSDIRPVRAATVAVVQFFFASNLEDIINCDIGDTEGQPCKYQWWAGGVKRFVAPIRKFTAEIAKSVYDEEYVRDLQKQLRLIGVMQGSRLNLLEKKTFAKFLHNLMFIQSVLHSYAFGGREFISPFGGIPHDAEFVPLLKNATTDQMSLAETIETVIPFPDQYILTGSVLSFSTSIGLQGGPELGDGPYYNVDDDEDVQSAIRMFRRDLADAKKKIKTFFGPFEKGRYLPMWFYPTSTPKPYGYLLFSTVYI